MYSISDNIISIETVNARRSTLKRNRRVRRTPVSDPGFISEHIQWFAGARYEIGVRRHKPFRQIKSAHCLTS